MAREVRVHQRGLVGRLGEVVGETAGTRHPSDLGDGLGTSNGEDVWARSWELGREDGYVLRVLATSANAGVARGFEDGNSTDPHHGDQVADSRGVVNGDRILIIFAC